MQTEKLKHRRQLKTWFEQALKENPEARENIHRYIEPRLNSHLQLLEDPDQLAAILSETHRAIDSHLSEWYLLYQGENRNISNVFIDHSLSLLHKIVRQKSRMHFRNSILDFIPDYDSRIASLLPALKDTQQDVIRLMIYGDKSISQVAQELKISKEAVRQRLHRARLMIEPALIEPFGIKRITYILDEPMQEAAYDGTLEHFKFLDLCYTDEEAIMHYTSRSRYLC
ncbi:hypothetical protein A3F00_00340 [Candidatus Daviesbacteria bacterium RIFCSPHIGHO2_12_FULL_37_11]|uniref:RNA polymerase sigma-70 region 4 domain-containing protein n=1 Tax=Candidatus Daviesbacteria bacterium RIFCSPHIGHO2_12_FULL_37_11 TaxID=1797777 RepID=A0A1F5KAU6_9BACT|nr:MAG: hypothetical protein A2111_01435 [Candidatus Daviesbacteria bacterium GWA1_38_6]OGE16269.1 MAG: hypothetical protein A2769_03265 [Candidatus Daviesbacteria bacterium RIFCSPHIGHO2_01_FULL_37_27]OGE37940.1 MAG: hypothetical protein A3F00_00340 [Candidatus Daviesbacteria bacterium RIFCSPHIGHO2_12_FULL_37_11]OGE45266.1 MAG: hypothetical protein A3B39_04025 [Candidatus Daviesbacteria bacterium RIFCSPLOWO2_01_FULL_37_10]